MCADAKIRHLSINKRCRIQPLILLCALFLPDNILFLLSSVMSIIPQQETSENYNRRSQFVSPIQIIPQQETSENYNWWKNNSFTKAIIPQQETSENYNTQDSWANQTRIIPQQETSENYNSRDTPAPPYRLYHNKKHQGTTTVFPRSIYSRPGRHQKSERLTLFSARIGSMHTAPARLSRGGVFQYTHEERTDAGQKLGEEHHA